MLNIIISKLNIFAYIIAPIFYKFVYMSIIASIVGIVIIFVNKFLIKKISPKALSLMWITFLFTLLIPINISTKFSIYNYIPEKILIFNTEIENIKDISFRQEYDNAKAEFKEYSETLQSREESEALLEDIDNAFYKSLVFDVILPCLWFLVSLLLILIYFSSYIIFSLKNKKNICEDKRLLDILETCKKRLNVKKDIKLVYQDKVKVPAIFGIFNVRILINENLKSVEDSKIEYIFMHELSHYKRHDNLFIILVMCIKSIYFFNPVIYFMLKQLIKDIECATDEIAIKDMDSNIKKEYAKTLLEFTQINNKKFVAKALCISDDKKNLQKRIIMIKTSDKFKKNKVFIYMLSFFFIAVMLLVFCTTKVSNNIEELNFKEFKKYENINMEDYNNIKEIVSKLPFGDLNKDVIIGTSKKELLIDYDMLKQDMKINSLILFTCIKDLDKIGYTFRNKDKITILRTDFSKYSLKDIDTVKESITSTINFGNSKSYDVTVNKYADIVFKDRRLAFYKFKKDYKKELQEIKEKFNLLPLNIWNYQEYKEASFSMSGENFSKITEFFDIYTNSLYVSSNTNKYPMKYIEVSGSYVNSELNLGIIGNSILSNYFYSYKIDFEKTSFVLLDSKVIAGDRDEFVVLIKYKLLDGKYDTKLTKNLGKSNLEGWIQNDVMLRIKKVTDTSSDEIKYKLIEIGESVSTDGLKILNNKKIPERAY